MTDDQDRPAPPAPKSARPWLALLDEAERALRGWQDKADGIDRLYANLEKQASPARDREFAMFWANVQVLAPAIYSRPPVPVVVPRFNDRRPVPRLASEVLERAAAIAFEEEDIDQVMRLVRDDLAILARGVVWCRFEKRPARRERVGIEHVDRKDFRHDPARSWKECAWVAKRSWLTREEMRRRFRRASGEAWRDAEFAVRREDRDNGAAGSGAKAGVWEIWHRSENRVVWVAPGCERVLDDGEPHLTLEGFFPCPRPAYGTLQRRSLVPVPDFAFYKDQLEEINELTARISALTEAVKVRGFYPAGAGEIGDAIEAAIKATTNNQVMVPISNWAAFGNGGARDMIVWLPIDVIVKTIAGLVELRRHLIDDVYQITGLSDIMRGATDPGETLGAQQLKSQFGSIRVRDRHNELVRIARDTVRIAAEIMAENFSAETLLDMAQMELPAQAELKEREEAVLAQAGAKVQAALADPEIRARAAQEPGLAERMLAELEKGVEAEIAGIRRQPTVETVMALLRAERIRPFALDIETDSTAMPDENAEKRLRAEFLSALSGTLRELAPLVSGEPGAASFAGEVLKFALAPYRAGRELAAAVDDFVGQMRARAARPAEASAETDKAGEQAKEMEARFALERLKLDSRKLEMGAAERQQDLQMRIAEMQAEARRDAERHAQELQKGELEIGRLQLELAAMREKIAGEAAAGIIRAAAGEPAR